MENQMKQLALSLGADVCGIAGIDRFSDAPKGFHPKDLFSECRSVIVFGVALPRGLTLVDPKLIYGHFNEETCRQADQIAYKAAKKVEALTGGNAVPVPSDEPYDYWDADNMEGRGLLSMKHAAVKAGLGTMGKSTLLINRQYGNLLNLGMILTDIELKSDPYSESLCIAGCRRCIDNCPSQALNDQGVIQKNCRLHTYGTNSRGFATVNCNACRVVCPMRFGEKVD